MLYEFFACPVCKSDLREIAGDRMDCLGCGRSFPLVSDIPILLPDELGDFKRLEAEYHTLASDTYAAVNMIDSLRVLRYHDAFLKPFKTMASGALVFEVAGGDGSDALKLLEMGLKVVQTDISLGMVCAAKSRIPVELMATSAFAVCDAENLPCKPNSLSAIMIVGALHHLPSALAFFIEAARALRPDGILVIGFEPNTWQYKSFHPFLRRIKTLLSSDQGEVRSKASIGDQETQGFSYKQFSWLAAQSGLEFVDVQRVWYLNGFIHALLCHYNAKRDQSRQIDLPNWIQKLIISIDDTLSKIPLVRNYCWHWSVVLRKTKA
jgi:ubiquinone/menaquinone biosynthesis C-methylase UbiE